MPKFIKCEQLKIGNYFCVGMLDNQYVFENYAGFADIPVWYPISKEEFDSFDDWKDDSDFILGTILNRKSIGSGIGLIK